MRTADRRPSANDTDRVMLGTRFAMTSQDARTVHAVATRHDSVAMCGTAVRHTTYGEESRLPLCTRCKKVAQAEFDSYAEEA